MNLIDTGMSPNHTKNDNLFRHLLYPNLLINSGIISVDKVSGLANRVNLV